MYDCSPLTIAAYDLPLVLILFLQLHFIQTGQMLRICQQQTGYYESITYNDYTQYINSCNHAQVRPMMLAASVQYSLIEPLVYIENVFSILNGSTYSNRTFRIIFLLKYQNPCILNTLIEHSFNRILIAFLFTIWHQIFTCRKLLLKPFVLKAKSLG